MCRIRRDYNNANNILPGMIESGPLSFSSIWTDKRLQLDEDKLAISRYRIYNGSP
jgi:hypothetical protein